MTQVGCVARTVSGGAMSQTLGAVGRSLRAGFGLESRSTNRRRCSSFGPSRRPLRTRAASVSDAARVFLTRVVAEQQLPFALRAPNADTRMAMEEARTISKGRFASAQALIRDLEKGAEQ